jgi:hypothetical protein
MEKDNFKLKLWETPQDYFGENYFDHYVLYGRHRDSDALPESNFRASISRLMAVEGQESEKGWMVVRATHWAVGWVETILIHKDAKELVEVGQNILNSLKDYPVLDDELYSELEIEFGEVLDYDDGEDDEDDE